MYQLPCDQCDQPVTVSASKAGQQIPCPHCGQGVVVPKLGELKRSQSETPPQPGMGQSTSAESDATDRAGGRNSGSRDSDAAMGNSIVFITLAFLAMACCVIAFYCAIRWFLIEVPTTTQDHIAEVTAAIKQASAAQLIVEYESLEKYGIDVVGPFPYQVTANTKAKWGLNATVAALLGLVALIAAAVSTRRPKTT